MLADSSNAAQWGLDVGDHDRGLPGERLTQLFVVAAERGVNGAVDVEPADRAVTGQAVRRRQRAANLMLGGAAGKGGRAAVAGCGRRARSSRCGAAVRHGPSPAEYWPSSSAWAVAGRADGDRPAPHDDRDAGRRAVRQRPTPGDGDRRKASTKLASSVSRVAANVSKPDEIRSALSVGHGLPPVTRGEASQTALLFKEGWRTSVPANRPVRRRRSDGSWRHRAAPAGRSARKRVMEADLSQPGIRSLAVASIPRRPVAPVGLRHDLTPPFEGSLCQTVTAVLARV